MPTEPARSPRPVTPVGIVAELLGRVLRRLDADDRLDDAELGSLLDDLRHAERIAGGLEPYLERCTTAPSPELERLAARTAAQDWESRRTQHGSVLEQEMLSGHVEGALLRFLVGVTGARHVLDIGMFTGYSALAMAEGLPEGGRVVACELDAYAVGLAVSSFAPSPVGSRIEVEVGPALDTLARLGRAGRQFDFVFIDADKPSYGAYLDAVIDGDLLSRRGLVCVDNTLMQGEPWAQSPSQRSVNGEAIRDFNAQVAADSRLEQVVVPLRDGITLIRRR